jgi:hypothetical protein
MTTKVGRRLTCALAACVLAFAPEGARAGTLADAVLGQRPRDGGHDLLLEVQAAVAGTPVDRVTLDVGRKAAKDAVAGTVPPGWSLTVERGLLVFAGKAPSAGERLALSASLGEALRTGDVAVEVGGGGKVLAQGDASVQDWPAADSALDPNDLLSAPPVVGAKDLVELKAEGATLPPGTWTVGDALAEAGDDGKLTVTLGHDWSPGLKLGASYQDSWGATLSYGTLEDVAIVPPGDPEEPPRLDACSPKVLTGGILCACGFFPTAESRTSLTLNGRPLGAPLSSSSAVLTFRLPDVPPGEFVLAGPESAGFPPGSSATGLHVKVGGSIDRDLLLRGESTPLRLWLEGTKEPLSLKLWNTTPGVVSLDGGNDQVVTTSGGEPNQVQRMVHAVTAGDFNVSYKLSGQWCPCAEQVAQAAVLAAGGAVPSSTATRPCSTSAGDCDRLKELAEAAARAAGAAPAEAGRLAANRRWTGAGEDWIRESGERTDAYVDTLRRQAQDWRDLAADARADAAKNRERDAKYPGTGWDHWAEQAEQEAARRDAEAEALDAEADRVAGNRRRDEQRADELEDAVLRAEHAALRAEAEAEKARAAWQACVRALRSECPLAEVGSILYDGPVRVTGPDGTDPRDVDPKDPDAKICGPDVTDRVLRVLDRMIDDHDAATPADRAKACENINTLQRDQGGVMIAEYAWDIYALGPGIAPSSYSDPGQFWYEGVSPVCARPRSPCGPTVTFLGQCVHSQVVNYMQWGAMNALCDTETTGQLSHWARATAGGVKTSLGDPGNWQWKTASYPAQVRMSETGSSYVSHRRRHDADPDLAGDPASWPPERQRELRSALLADELGAKVAGDADWAARGDGQCAMICRLTAAQDQAIDDKLWSYNWLGLRGGSPDHTGRLPKR